MMDSKQPYIVGHKQFDKVVESVSAEPVAAWFDADLMELKVPDMMSQKIKALKPKMPYIGAEVVITWTPQGEKISYVERGKVLTVTENGKFTYDAITAAGASGCAVTDPNGNVIYGWHTTGGTGTSNTGHYFSLKLLKEMGVQSEN
jgi:hypothetical protein